MNHNELEDLTSKAEDGDIEAVSKVLNDLSPRERVQVAQQMDEINRMKRDLDPSLPDLVISTAEVTDQELGTRYRDLTDMYLEQDEGPWHWMWNDGPDRTDVYKPLEDGGLISQQVGDRKRKLDGALEAQ